MNDYKNIPDDGFPWIARVVFILLILVMSFVYSDPQLQSPQNTYDPNTETWRDYLPTNPGNSVEQRLTDLRQLVSRLEMTSQIYRLNILISNLHCILFKLNLTLQKLGLRKKANDKPDNKLLGLLSEYWADLLQDYSHHLKSTRKRFLSNIGRVSNKKGRYSESKNNSVELVQNSELQNTIDTTFSEQKTISNRTTNRRMRRNEVNINSPDTKYLASFTNFFRENRFARGLLIIEITLIIAIIAIFVFNSI